MKNENELPDELDDDIFGTPDPTSAAPLDDAIPYTGGDPAVSLEEKETVEVDRPIVFRSEEDNMFYFKFTIGEERTYGPYKTASIAEYKIKAILEALS
jgi:hypothetical protein